MVRTVGGDRRTVRRVDAEGIFGQVVEWSKADAECVLARSESTVGDEAETNAQVVQRRAETSQWQLTQGTKFG